MKVRRLLLDVFSCQVRPTFADSLQLDSDLSLGNEPPVFLAVRVINQKDGEEFGEEDSEGVHMETKSRAQARSCSKSPEVPNPEPTSRLREEPQAPKQYRALGEVHLVNPQPN